MSTRFKPSRFTVPTSAFAGPPKRINPASCVKCRNRNVPDCALKASSMYSTALELAREERFDAARQAFEEVVVACPCWQKPWVSYAQMEKRAAQCSEQRWNKCREILQRALVLNPESVEVIQAWGLMELKKGNLLPAVRLLERCVRFDPVRCEAVLRWKPVAEARKTVSSRNEQRRWRE